MQLIDRIRAELAAFDNVAVATLQVDGGDLKLAEAKSTNRNEIGAHIDPAQTLRSGS
jgi:hypothetical protein